jgi:S1-C subfamily serine protease
MWVAVALLQDPEPLRVHAELYKRMSPAVVGIRSGSRRGSGVVVSKEGWVLSSLTATGAQGDSVEVFLKGHKKVAGRVVERNQELELAILRIDPGHVQAVAPLGDSDSVRTGAVCYILGDSFNSIFTDDQVAFSLGHVTGLYEIKATQGRSTYKGPVLETNAAVNVNGDGGPMMDGSGRVVGMVTLNYHEAKLTGLAIPINRLKETLQRCMTRSPEPWLGFQVDSKLRLGPIAPSSPALRAGLKEGDLLLKLGDRDVKSPEEFAARVKEFRAGQELKVHVRRGSEQIQATLKVETRDFY